MKVKIDLKDILVIAGSLLVGYGVWRIFPPAAYIAIGIEMCFLGYYRS
jgi:hypothetical protein